MSKLGGEAGDKVSFIYSTVAEMQADSAIWFKSELLPCKFTIMPRKKKRYNKKSLSFEESPKNVVRNLPSPVYGADHPTTADVIALDGSVNIPWVSPDANLVRCPLTMRYRRTRRHTGASTTHNATSVTPTHKHRVNSKIKPLKFIGDVSVPEASTAEDISVDELLSDEAENCSSVSFRRSGKRLQILAESKRHPPNNETQETSREWSPVLKTRTAKIRKTKRKTGKQRGKPNIGELFSSDSEVSLLNEPRVNPDGFTLGKVCNRLGGTMDTSCDTSLVFEKNVDEEIECTFSKNHDASFERERQSESFKSTQHRRGQGVRRKNARRLFDETENLNNKSITGDKQSNVLDSAKDRGHRKSIHQHSNVPPDYGSDFSPSSSHQRRRSFRLRHLLSPRDSPLRSPQQMSRVLVYDTPEEDYDLPVRQRRLRNWKQVNQSLRVSLTRQ